MSKRKTEDALGKEMEALALKLAQDLTAGAEVSKTTSDTFGKLTSYFASTRKLNLKAEDDDDASNFRAFRDKINNASTGTA